MNVFSYKLAESELDPTPDHYATKFVVDDNIGEAIHIHYRNFRLEFSVEDFVTFAEQCEQALEELDNGSR